MKYLLIIISLAFMFCQEKVQAQPPVAVNDTFQVYHVGDTITVNVVQNDYNPAGHPIFVYFAPGSLSHTDSTITYCFPYEQYWRLNGLQPGINYLIADTFGSLMTDYGQIYFNIHNQYYDFLDINKVYCRINNNGNHFWDLLGAKTYNVPKGSGHEAIFSFASWIAGQDVNGLLHLAADRYGSNGQDFFPGPLTDANHYDKNYDSLYNRVWKLNKTEIDYHKTHWWFSGYQAPEAILSWPGNGDPSIGQMAQQAPYHDINNNEIYEPMGGDYPLIKGDQAVFFIQNDIRRPHTETQGQPLGIEIHGMAYAFDCPNDSALLYTTFLHYDIYNRSPNTYHDVAFGTFVDVDLGYAWDDYIGCDVGRGSFYGYNGTNTNIYNDAISTTILGGPYLNPDGLDNPSTDQFGNPLCDISINGANFNDGVIDNERYGMNSFIYFTNGINGPTTDPAIAADYAKYLNLQWKDGIHIQYGGNGHPNSGATGPDCNFMFPDLSDFCNWGTAGMQPPGFQTGAGGSGIIWNESNVGNPPDDRRGLVSMGPFTFQPNQKQELDVAFVWANDYSDSIPASAIQLLQSRIDQIRYYYQQDSTPCGSSFSGIATVKNDSKSLRLYPNPANDQLNIEYDNSNGKAVYSIMGIAGNLVVYGSLDRASLTQLSLGNLNAGMYIIKVDDGNCLIARKFIKK